MKVIYTEQMAIEDAMKLCSEKKFAEAAQLYEQVLKREPGHPPHRNEFILLRRLNSCRRMIAYAEKQPQ